MRSFLKLQGLSYSAGSWEELFNKRIQPAVNNGDLSLDSLIDLLRECEEHGKQHVFLYKVSRSTAQQYILEDRVRSVARQMAIEGILTKPKILDTPKQPTYTEIRWESDNSVLVIKIVETKESHVPTSEKIEGNILTKKFEIIAERVVNVIKLSSKGLLEIRIGSRRHSSGGYTKDLERVWSMVEPFFERKQFIEKSLGRAKNAIWERRTELTSLIKYSDATLRNDHGTLLRAATGSKEVNLHDDKGATISLERFMEHSGYCDSSNIYFRQQANGIPSKDIHVLISGLSNEFALTVHCPKKDYDYVFKNLTRLNTKIS